MIENSENHRPKNHTQPKESTSPAKSRHRERIMLVRYGKMGLIGLFRHSEREIPRLATNVIVNTERGLEIGKILSSFCHKRGSWASSEEVTENYCRQSGPNYPITHQGRFVRFATQEDLNEQRHIELEAKEKARFCTELIKKHGLPMRLVETEHLFGGDRIIFYFMSEGRVDFRQLVKELASGYQIRIEMRQIGARDEARLIADFETCGRECCCKGFLKVLQPVNMRMAKMQKATLDPSKISGRCGRLKCCLRYEDQVYGELAQKLPRNNTWVLLEEHGAALVLETQIITQLVKVRLESGRVIAINVDEIKQYNCPAPKISPLKADADDNLEKQLDAPADKQSEETSGPETPRKKKRRRRRRKKNSEK